MHQQVRVAPDGRGEVRVMRVGQAEVAGLLGAVDGLLHRAQAHRLDRGEVRARPAGLHQAGVVGGRGIVAAVQGQPQLAQEGAQRLQLFRGRAVVHAEQRLGLVAHDEIRRAGVGRQHAFLDQAVGVVARVGLDALDAAQRVADDAGLDRVEVDGAALAPGLLEGLEQVVGRLHVGQQIAQALPRRAAGLLQGRPDVGVGGAGVGMDDGFVELVGGDGARLGAARRDHHVAHHHQAVDVRIERADAVGQGFRQHGDDAAREVHAGAAVQGVLVQRRAGPHVVADVGDGDQQPPAGPRALGRAQVGGHAEHRVVVVAGVLAVDGDEGHVAQVDAPGPVLRAHVVGDRGQLPARGVGEFHRHVELAHGDLDLHAGVVDLAQDLDHAAQGLEIAGRLAQDLHRDHLAGLGARRVLGRDQDVVLDALVLGRDDEGAVLLQEAADQLQRAPLDDLDDGAFGAAAEFAGFLYPHAVAVQDLRHFVGRQEQVLAAFVGDQEAEAVPVSLDGAGDEVRVVADLQPSLGVVAQLAVAFHGLDAADEARGQGDRGMGGVGEGFEGQGLARLAQGVQHLLAGGDVGVEIRGETVRWRVGSVAVIVVVGSLFQRLFASKKIVLYSSVFAERRAKQRSGSAKTIAYTLCSAQVAELVDAHGSGPCAARCGGSSPLLGTTSWFQEVQCSPMSSGIKKRNPHRH